MKVSLIDVPRGAPHPFEPADARLFVLRTAGGVSRLFRDDAPLRDLDFLTRHFPMGYTNLWVLERTLLRVGDTIHRWPAQPPTGLAKREGRYYPLRRRPV